MRMLLPLTVAAALLFAVFAIQPGYSDDAKPKAESQKSAADKTQKSESTKKKSESTKKKRAFRGRLPNNYGKVGVTAVQRKQIYALQVGYKAQIDELRKKIKDLTAKRDAEVFAVLTDSQKEKLNKLREATKKRAADQTKKKESAKKSKTE